MQLHLQFTTVAQKLNQGIRRNMGVICSVLTFWFFCVKTKEQKELRCNRRRGFQPPTGFQLTPVRILSIISYFRPDCKNYDRIQLSPPRRTATHLR
jgi:hypothetical protein